MTSSNQISLIPINNRAAKFEIDKEYTIKLHSMSVWTDGDVRLMCSIDPLLHTADTPGNPPPQIDYESQEFQDELQEILDDTATEGDGHWRPGNLIHHLRKRGYKLVYADKEE
jgi:hypothetical protein